MVVAMAMVMVVVIGRLVRRVDWLKIGVSVLVVLVVKLYKELRHTHPAEDQLRMSDDVSWICVRRDLKSSVGSQLYKRF